MHNLSFWQKKLRPYTSKSNTIASRQIILTLIPFVLLWAAYAQLVQISYWVVLPFAAILSLFILRFFALMHDCGHGSMFESRRANQIVGFFLGVVSGMPQPVWAQNHAYHHKTNGDWVQYGGVFNILSTDKYVQLSQKEKRNYWLFRQPAILLPAGFFYVLLNPRFNWIVGTLLMIFKIIVPVLKFNFSEAKNVASKWETKYWKSKKNYLHMTYNNLVLFLIWAMMCVLIGPLEFFLLYVLSTSLSGSLGILTFTIQHNFEDSYAAQTQDHDYCRAAIEGTSMLVLPKVLNWFTADIAYHHVHHLSPAIPNYRLKQCHSDLAELFTGVKRVYLRDLLGTFKYQLWDPQLQKVVPRPE